MARETQMGACLLQNESFSASASGVPSGCVEQAHSLVGFSCENQNSNFYCLKPTIFSGSDNYCMTISAAAGMGNKVNFGHRLNKGSLPCSPELQCGQWGTVGQYQCACSPAPAQPAVSSAAAWPLSTGTLCKALTPTAQEGKSSPAQIP